MNIKFHSEARIELIETAKYYENQEIGLGNNFIDEIENTIKVISQQPFAGKKISDGERRFLVSRFPYGIIYSVENNLIIIYAIMNLKRKPEYWTTRV